MDLSVGGSGPRLAQRVVHLRAEGAYHVLAQAQALEAAGRDILHLEVGEPDFLAAVTRPHPLPPLRHSR